MSDSTTLLILGASGDLTERLLLPGLASLIVGDDPDDARLLTGLKLVGSGRSEYSSNQWRDQIEKVFDAGEASGELAGAIAGQAEYVVADPSTREGWDRLLKAVEGDLIIYFALPPSVVATVTDLLKDLDLPERTVLALEKPFGDDADSARRLNEQLAAVVPEGRIHRVDHFLGQRPVLATLALRFNNRLLEPTWNADNVERVEITYDERLGLENRAGYYDRAGALRDMLQSHLLQVLAVVATEPPVALDAVNLRDALAAALRATRVWSGPAALPGTEAPSRRARYTAGDVGDKHLPSYIDEEGVDPANETETLAEIALEVDTARWAGTPFVLRSGKAIGEPRDEVALTFRPVRRRPDGQTGEGETERIVLGFKPPRLALDLTAEGGSQPFRLEPETLSAPLPKSAVTEYGEVLRGVLGDDPALSVRGDVAEQCWRIVQPVFDAWRRGDVPLEEYPAGSQGPESWGGSGDRPTGQ